MWRRRVNPFFYTREFRPDLLTAAVVFLARASVLLLFRVSVISTGLKPRKVSVVSTRRQEATLTRTPFTAHDGVYRLSVVCMCVLTSH